jgi:hypothetical protein
VIIHQGIINAHNTMSPQEIIVTLFSSNIMSMPKTFKDVMEHVGARGDEHINHFHPDHIADHLAHPTRNHSAGKPQKDDALGIIQHPSKNFKAFKEISALERGMLEGLDQIEKVLDPLEI